MFNAQQLAVALTDPVVMALSAADAAAQPGWSAPVVTPTPYFVGHRKMLDVCCAIDPAHGVAAAEWVAGALKAQLPTTYDVYVTGTDPAGSTGGLDVSNPATVAFVNQLVTAAAQATPPLPFAAAMGNAVIALGQRIAYAFGGPVLASDVTAARAAIAAAAAYAAVNADLDRRYGVGHDWILAQQVAGAPAPTTADVLAKLGAA